MRWLLAIFIVILLFGCEVRPDPDPLKWKEGDMVQVIISGDKGMIVDSVHYNHGSDMGSKVYWVRLAPESQITDSGFLADDTKVERLPIIRFKEFELTAAPKESDPVVYDSVDKFKKHI